MGQRIGRVLLDQPKERRHIDKLPGSRIRILIQTSLNLSVKGRLAQDRPEHMEIGKLGLPTRERLSEQVHAAIEVDGQFRTR